MDGALTSTRCRILGVHLFAAECSCFSRRLYVRILRPDKNCCTLQRRPGAAIQVRHRAVHAVARKSCTQCATIANERFVTGFGLPRVQLATTSLVFLALLTMEGTSPSDCERSGPHRSGPMYNQHFGNPSDMINE